jgi:hypothetical protein
MVSVVLLVGFALWALSGAAGAADGDIQCGAVITQDTVLDHDLLDCEGAGLVVGAPNVTLDLGGHEIAGRGNGIGVNVFDQQSTGAVVRNGTVRAFATGVWLRGSATVSNLEISFNGIGVASFGSQTSRETVATTIEKSTIHHNGSGVAGGLVDGWGDFRIVDNRILNNELNGISAFRWWPLVIQGNLIKTSGSSGVELIQSHAQVLDNTFDRNGHDGLAIIDCGHTNFFRVGANLARENGNLGLSVNPGCPDASDLLDVGGNAASRNGDPQECTANLVCARNRGQATKVEAVTAHTGRHDEDRTRPG